MPVPPDHPLHHDRHVRSNGYDPDWVIANQMGPNALWLLESLLEVLPIESDAKVLDLGCGTAMTSIFLARELGARVWATDLWIPAAANQERVVAAGVDDLVTPIHAEAHALPYAAGFFDVIVSIDAYHYFGTDDLYLGTAVDLLGDGGRIGVAVPSMLQEPDDVPDHLVPFWEPEYCSFHSPSWWRRHWTRSGRVEVDHADAVPDGWRDWLRFTEASGPAMEGWRADAAATELRMLEADGGEHLGFARVVATRTV